MLLVWLSQYAAVAVINTVVSVFCSCGCQIAAVTCTLVNNAAVAFVNNYAVAVATSIAFISFAAVTKGNGVAVAYVATVAVTNVYFYSVQWYDSCSCQCYCSFSSK